MKHVLAVCLFLLSITLAPSQAQARRVLYTLAVGNNLPPADHPELRALRYADDDAVRMYELFAAHPERAVLLATLDADSQRRHAPVVEAAHPPAYANMRTALERFKTAMHQDRARGDTPVLFLSFSGHGTSDAAGLPALSLIDVPLTRARLYDELLPLLAEAEVHLIIDACHADGVIGVRGAFDRELEGETRPLGAGEQEALLGRRMLARFPNVGALVAAASDQETHEWSRIESGVFTHEVLSALRGAADVNGDLKLAYSEVQAFIAAANRDVPDPRARPTVLSHPPRQSGDALLLALDDLPGTRLLYGDAGRLGHFHVELENGERLLDAHLVTGQRAVMALPDKTLAFVRNGEQEAEIEGGSTHVALASLRFRERDVATRGSVDQSLRQKLWQTPFGPTYYRGYVDSTNGVSVAFANPASLPQRDGEPWLDAGRARRAFIASTVVSGASLIAFATSLGLAISAKHDFEQTEQERTAHQLRDDVELRSRVALATGVVAAATGASAVFFYTRVAREPRGGATASITLRLRF